VVPPQLISRVNPVYPPAQRAAGTTGSVVLDCTIDDRGRVKEIKVVRGSAGFVQAAQAAVVNWQYKPATINGHPVASSVEVSLDFRK
jgi:protein TonB